ncbi:MAG TPA: hypothetical protein VMF03_03210 [Steroidobacteraceae bacterium]|nr:hypothetical protein [Steroidobacteraceae bacterium]
MATKTIIRRPAKTAGELLDALKAFEGKGADPRRKRDRKAAGRRHGER